MTSIEWVRNPDGTSGKTWNPTTGCSHAGGPGCDMCYARRMARRLAGRHGYPEAPHHFDVTLRPDRLDIPPRRKKPTTYFICSMSDLFHKNVPPWFVCEVWQVMRECPQHTFQILTKRPSRMLRLIKTYIADHEFGIEPLPNVWLGVSVENQDAANVRILVLLQIPAAVRFVSLEPMLGEIDLTKVRVSSMEILNALTGESMVPHSEPPKYRRLDWVICGGESGPGARPMHPDWAREIRDQCQAAGVPFFFKSWGAWLQVHPDRKPYEFSQPANRCATVGSDRFYRVGKRAAGRLLDGKEWNEMPEMKSR